MACNTDDGLIKEGDQVIVRREKNLKVVPVRRNCKLWIERAKFFLDSAIGFPYGTSFEVVDQKLVKVEKPDDGDLDLDTEEDDEGMRDNRNLTDTSENQKLSSDEIRSMRKDGVHGEEIIEQLIQNSATFNQKNEYSKQKYIKKKQKKYVSVITVLKPSSRLLLEMYYNKGPSRICNLRLDSLSQLLAHGNVQAGSQMLVVESCVGLVVGAVMERMGGRGTIVQIYSGAAPVQQAVESYDFPKQYMDNLVSYPLTGVKDLIRPGQQKPSQINSEATAKEKVTGECRTDAMDTATSETQEAPKSEAPETSEPVSESVEGKDSVTNDVQPCGDCGNTTDGNNKGVKRKQTTDQEEVERKQRWENRQRLIQTTKARIEKCDSDGLIVVSKFNPTPIVMSLIDFVAPSRPIAVFCQYKEPLMDLYIQLKTRGGVVLIKLTETWLRGHQILPERTHPKIKMSGTGGYLLTGTTVRT